MEGNKINMKFSENDKPIGTFISFEKVGDGFCAGVQLEDWVLADISRRKESADGEAISIDPVVFVDVPPAD